MRPEPFVNRGVALQLGRWSIDRMAGRFRGVAYRFPSPASTPERRCCLLSNEFGVFGLGACVHVVGLLTFVWSNAAHACDVMHHACCMPASHGICPRPAGARTARYILPFQIADCERRSQRGRDRAQTHPDGAGSRGSGFRRQHTASGYGRYRTARPVRGVASSGCGT